MIFLRCTHHQPDWVMDEYLNEILFKMEIGSVHAPGGWILFLFGFPFCTEIDVENCASSLPPLKHYDTTDRDYNPVRCRKVNVSIKGKNAHEQFITAGVTLVHFSSPGLLHDHQIKMMVFKRLPTESQLFSFGHHKASQPASQPLIVVRWMGELRVSAKCQRHAE